MKESLMPERTVEDRFWVKVDRNGPMCPELGTQCWIWTAGKDSPGYGVLRCGGGMVGAHRMSCEWGMGMFWGFLGGPQVDHKCRVRACVRPSHLRPATNKQNQENLPGAQKSRSGIRGVVWVTNKSKWRAQATHNGRFYTNGFFDVGQEAEAGIAAIELRNRLFTFNDLDQR
jgi:hypothetical protein